MGGRHVPARSGPRGARAAMETLRSTYTGKLKKPSYWEPKWFDAAESIEAARRLKVANIAEISAGLGLSPSPLPEMRAVRNYLAHKSSTAVAQLQVYLPAPDTDKVHAHLCDVSLGGASRFEGWSLQLEQMARIAAA